MIRDATSADATACASIYAPYVTDTTISFESEPPGAAAIAARIAAAHVWLVAEEQDGVAGYAYASRHRDREAYRWAVDVAIYLRAASRGRGLGRALYAELLARVRERGFCVACAGVTLPNTASEALHRAAGFREVGVYRRIGYKFERWHDVRWYQLELQPPSYHPSGQL